MALWDSPAALGQRAVLAGDTRLSVLPFDHERRLVSVLVRDQRGAQTIVTKGAPEAVLGRCVDVPATATAAVAAEFAAGNRVVAVATRPGSASPSRSSPGTTRRSRRRSATRSTCPPVWR